MKVPQVNIIAGPNGAGKTTFATEFLPKFADCTEFVNADLLALGISPFSPETAAIEAGRLMLERIKSLAERRIDFGFETTLAGKGFVNLIHKLRRQGYSINIFFLWLPSADLALDRVTERVKRGGHSIPAKTVKRRYSAGLKNFVNNYSKLADEWILFDNSSQNPIIIAQYKSHSMTFGDEKQYNEIIKGHRNE